MDTEGFLSKNLERISALLNRTPSGSTNPIPGAGAADARATGAQGTVRQASVKRPSSPGSDVYKGALASLQRVSRAISGTLDLGHILDLICQEAVQLSQASRGAIVLRHPQTDGWKLEVCSGYSPAEQGRFRQALQRPESHPLLAPILETGQPFIYTDGGEEGTLRSALVTPVFYSESLTGSIILESSRQTAFDRGIQKFVETLAAQMSIAVGNDQRYKDQVRRGELLRLRADQIASVLEISQALRSDRPLEDILEEIVYAIQESVGFARVMISVLEGDPPYQRRVAAAGIPLNTFERMKETQQPWALFEEAMREEFRISYSYYVPAEHQDTWRDRLDIYTVRADDVTREPGRWHPNDMLLVPLIGPGGDTQGLLSVDQPIDGNAPNQATVEALEVFAGQAALAIENAQLVETLQHRADTLALFNEVSRSATAKLDLDEVLHTVVEMVPRLVECTHSCIFLQDREKQSYSLRAAHGAAHIDDQAPVPSFTPGEGGLGRVAESGTPLAISEASPDRQSISDIIGVTPGPAALVPLTTGSQVAGVLCIGRQEDQSFSSAEVATLSALADQVAVAVENARLFDEVHRFSQELELRVVERTQALAEAMEELTQERDRVETLYRITSQLSASLDLDRVLHRALELVVQAVAAERAAVLMLTPQGDRLVYRAGLGVEEQLPPGGRPTRFTSREGLAGWAISHHQSAIVPDIQQDERWIESQDEEWTYRSALVVPLSSNNEVLGALLLFHTQIDYFDEDHQRLVEAAATQVTNAISNAELYSLIREQTERLGRMLKEQQVEAAKSQSILEGVADGVIVADANSRVTLINAAAERILDLPREEALGRMTSEMLGLYGSQAQDWMETVAGWAEDSKTYAVGEYLAARLEIANRIVSVHLAPVLMGDEFLGSVSVFRDVTAEVEAERAKSEFVSTVSHELRTPMTSVKGYADLIMMGAVGELTEKQGEFLTIIKDNADRLTALVNELLDLSRMESGRIELNPQVVDLDAAVTQVISAMEARAEEKNLILENHVPGDLPAVYADPDRVTQVLTNLVANACQYTPEGGEIDVSACVNGDKIHLAVRDTGIGISEDDLEKIFDRFFRADDDFVQEVEGTGLGLAIVKQLIEMHGEQIWVESDVGVGSTFTCSLPIAKPELVAQVAIEEDAERETIAPIE